MYLTTFTVEGSGAFPFDMLRYDTCYPDSSVSVSFMEGKEKRRVRLCRLSQYKPYLPNFIEGRFKGSICTPTADRWESFGWVVVEVWTRRI